MQTYNHFGRKGTHLAKLAKWLSCVGSTYLYGAFDCILSSCHVCDSAWIHTILPECQGTPNGNWCDIWSLSDCNGTRTHNHVVRKRTFNHLPKLANWLSCVMSTYLYGEFDCMLSCHVRDYPKGNFWSNTEKVTKFQLKLAILNIWIKFAQ